MTSYPCPKGHVSGADDYCDTCGAPIPSGAGMPTSPYPLPAGAAPGAAPAVPPPVPLPPAPPVPMPMPTPTPMPANLPTPANPPTAVHPAVPAPVPVGGGGPAASGGSGDEKPCPVCGVGNDDASLFCEGCGYDFVTGQLPRPADTLAGRGAAGAVAGGDLGGAGPVAWVAEIWVDPEWYAAQDVSDPCPSSGLPTVVPMVERSLLIGRRSTSRNIHPQLDLSGDNGVSRRHAQLTGDGQRWWVEDLQSANGTFVSCAGDPLPEQALTPGTKHELADGERILLGAWTRIVVRQATPGESNLLP